MTPVRLGNGAFYVITKGMVEQFVLSLCSQVRQTGECQRPAVFLF